MNFWEINKSHLEYICTYIKDRILCIVIILAIMIALISLIINNCEIKNPKGDVESQQLIIGGISIDNWSTIITTIGLGYTALWSMFQYSKTKLLSQQEKAAAIANEFANDLLERMYLINKVLTSNTEYSDLLEKINVENLKSFTVYEINQITNDEHIFYKFDKIIFSDTVQAEYEALLHERFSDSELEVFESKFPNLIQNTLNRLEFICMNISSTAAGSQFIYPSIHQMFLNSIYVLSPSISENNYNTIDKYFINIIQVYNLWTQEKKKDKKTYEKNKKKYEKHLKKYEKNKKKQTDRLLEKNPGKV